MASTSGGVGGGTRMRGVVSREGLRECDVEAGLAQVFLFVDAFRGTMVEGLSTVVPPPYRSYNASAGFDGGGGGNGGRLTLGVMQERVDVSGMVAALGPWLDRWRAQHPETSADLLEV